jgi:hypothetical protein
MLLVSSIMSANKVDRIIKNNTGKSIHKNNLICIISPQNRMPLCQSNRKDKRITIEIPHMGQNIWPFIGCHEIY